jgi:hypothetical protein
MSILNRKWHLIRTLSDADVLENSKPITSAIISVGPVEKPKSLDPLPTEQPIPPHQD